MYINLILGGVFFIGLWIFLSKLLVRDTAKNDSQVADDAGAILARELEERRLRDKNAETARERVCSAGSEKLDLLEKALEKMRDAMPGEESASLSWVREESGIRVRIIKECVPHVLALAWVPADAPGTRPAEAGNGAPKGYYRLRDPDANEEFFADLDSLIRKIATFIADLLA